jgi:hypothetical protein
MNEDQRNAVRAAEEAVAQLLPACRKGGPLYVKDPPVVAQVNRTARWLLSAITRMKRALGTPAEDPVA